MPRGSVWKRKSGAYALRYRGPDGRRHYEHVGRVRKDDAERALTAILRDIDAGVWRPPSTETLEAYATRWLELRDPTRTVEAGRGRTRLAPTTHAGYSTTLRLHVFPRLGDRQLASLRTEDIDELVIELEQEGKAAGTVRNSIVPLRKLLADAVRQGKLTVNPAANVDLPPAQGFVGVEIPPGHTDAIRAALSELAQEDPFRPGERDLVHVLLYDVALGTGMRLGELRALTWQHISRERRLIRVEQAWSLKQLRQPKTEAGIRSIPLFPSVDLAVQALAGRAVERSRYAPNELVFQTNQGKALDGANINKRVWTKALQHAGLGEWHEPETTSSGKREWTNAYRFHDLRHTCVSRLVAANADVKLVQAVAGHANPLITLQRYSHLTDARVTEAAERFDPAVTVKA